MAEKEQETTAGREILNHIGRRAMVLMRAGKPEMEEDGVGFSIHGSAWDDVAILKVAEGWYAITLARMGDGPPVIGYTRVLGPVPGKKIRRVIEAETGLLLSV